MKGTKRSKNLRERASCGHKLAEKHARVGFWAFLKTKKEKKGPENLRERGSSVHKWAEKHARVGFHPFQKRLKKEMNRSTSRHERAKHARVGFLGLFKD